MSKSSSEQHFYVNVLSSPLLCKISKALHLVQPGLTAHRQAGRQAGREILEFAIDRHVYH